MTRARVPYGLLFFAVLAAAVSFFPRGAHAQVTITNPNNLPPATQGVFYTQALAATGGTPPYTWSVVAGTPPPGVTLNGARLEGTPTSSGTFNFALRARDSSPTPVVGQKDFGLVVTAPPSQSPMGVTAPLPPATVGQPYNLTLSAMGGTPPYGWARPGGALPPGINFSLTTGQLTGTPTAAGTSSFTVALADASQPPLLVTRTFSLTVAAAAAGGLEMVSPLPPAKRGLPYSQTLTVSGGMQPYTWTVVAGAPPTNIVVGQTSGVLSGTPIQSGNTNFTVMVTDSGATPRTTTATFTLNVTD